MFFPRNILKKNIRKLVAFITCHHRMNIFFGFKYVQQDCSNSSIACETIQKSHHIQINTNGSYIALMFMNAMNSIEDPERLKRMLSFLELFWKRTQVHIL